MQIRWREHKKSNFSSYVNMKKCVLVNCFASSNEMRVEPIRKWFKEQGYETVYIASDFHHAKKEYVKLNKNITPIHVRKYKKNISISRIISHMEFSKKVYEKLCDARPDILYMKFPPNTLVKVAYKYRKKYKCRLILDVFDLWPEALPIDDRLKKIGSPLLHIWAMPRNKYLCHADLVFTECDMYQYKLKKHLPENTHTLYLMKEDIDFKPIRQKKDKSIRLCFLGGINNIINIELIEKVIYEIIHEGYLVSFDIIGDGDKRMELINKTEKAGAKVFFHGIVFDENKKYKIMSQCDFGINLVREKISIGLSIKSIEYFRAGIAIINNVPFDTWKLVKEYNAGINVYENNVIHGLGKKNINKMKLQARYIYCNFFSPQTFTTELSNRVNQLIK